MNNLESSLSATFEAALRMSMNRSERTIQSDEGRIGPSDIGWCRQKATLVTRGIPKSDSRPMWAAQVGTYVHNGVEAALAETYPTWKFGSIHNITVTATLPNGAQISGHPDIIAPELNAILDLKTVDGLAYAERNRPSQSDKYQRHLYAMGAIAAGLLDGDKPVYVGNVYLDRSGAESEPLVKVSEFDPGLTAEIDEWVSDVIYAAQHGEDAARDVPGAVCQKICEFYTVCRGGLEDTSGDAVLITDPDLISAIDLYNEGRETESRGKRMKEAARSQLVGVSGSTGEFQVRWVHVNEVEVAGFTRPATDRLDVVKVKRRG